MSKTLQISFACLVLASIVVAKPGYAGYPYGAPVAPVAHGYGAGPLPVPVHDTPEVAAAKAAHFAAYNHAAAAAAAAPDHGAYAGHGGYAGHGAYAGHTAAPAYPGHYAAPAYGGHYAAPAYAGHYAGVPGIVNGVPADTPEVAAAKAAHLAAHAKAAHHY